MNVLTAAQMAAFDRRCIDDRGIPGLLLMEHAGHLVARETHALLGRSGRVAVLCGGGNNGGDGFVAARHLVRWGHDVVVAALKPADSYSGDAAEACRLLTAVTGCEPAPLVEDGVEQVLGGCDGVVDALFGTGLDGEIRGAGRAAVEALNRSSLPVVAVDIPSGLSADGRGPLGRAVRAARTVTMGLPKVGFFTVEARRYLGALSVADIGFPRSELTARCAGESLEVVLAGEAVCWLPTRDDGAHKGDCGRLLVVGGSQGMAGAAAMAARAALRAGAGLVLLAVPASVRAEAAGLVPEVMTIGLPERDGCLAPEAVDVLCGRQFACDAVIVGPGMGRTNGVAEFLARFLTRSTTPLVVDADALFALETAAAFDGRPVVLTPHEGEAGRLCSVDGATVRSDRYRWVRRLAVQRNAVVSLKGPFTLTGDPVGRVMVNPTGNAGLATAGAGDVLAGMAGCFIAQMDDAPLLAAALAVYVHGLAADLAAATMTERALVATDVIAALPSAFRLLEAVEPADGDPYPAVLPQDRLAIIR